MSPAQTFTMTFILTGLLLSKSCGLFRTETFLISNKMKSGWISIEYDNPKCPPLSGSEASREFVVPVSGFVCTSSPRLTTAVERRYFLIDAIGGRIPLDVETQILPKEIVFVDEPALVAGQPGCKVKFEQFFDNAGQYFGNAPPNPIMRDERFLIDYHPECRQN